MPAKSPNPIDVYVGGRVRMRRIEVDMSQQTLGGHIDLTFQQIQKYEKGMNRIGSSRSGKPSKSRRPTFLKARPEAGNLPVPALTGRRTRFSNFSAQEMDSP